MTIERLLKEVRKELIDHIITFWKNLRDEKNGGFYGLMDFDLNIDVSAEKGCILNSRILWFFANAYKLLGDSSLLENAEYAYSFMKDFCYDKTYGGMFWSVNADGSVKDSTKHTYNQAFAIYALSSYYDVSGDKNALSMAYSLFNLIEEKCTDDVGYLESFTRDFKPEENDKLSENGVIAAKTMNTLLHVLEAYTEFYRVTKDETVRARLVFILNQFYEKVWNPILERQEVFFDEKLNSILDLYSYGHDIETSWLIDECLSVLNDEQLSEKLLPVTKTMAEQIYRVAYVNHSVLNECDRGVVNTTRVWWVQAESCVGFMNAYQKTKEARYLDAVFDIWEFIKLYVIDKRPDSEWFWSVDENGIPKSRQPIVEPWKCPYHNGRMCFELIKRIKQIEG
ncbi:AGE family epimerase/isomerase [Treponema porcinum]|uniref:AGE family epimerase/isomerase n=1 Tax=Treponema porcinum TaxID=261392 RepID=UPI003EFE0566